MASGDTSADALIAELVKIGTRGPDDWPGSSSRFLRDAKERARAIGKQLDAMGGSDYMMAAYETVRESLGSVAARELEAAWGGIGEWLG
jgi:hypothetical protein